MRKPNDSLTRKTPTVKSFAWLATVGALAFSGSALAAQWNLATPYGDASFHTKNTKQFAEDVTEATDGELTVTVHSGGSLISHGEIKPSVRRGTVQAGEIFLSILSNESPVYELDTLPGVASSYEEAFALWQASKPDITELFAKEGLMPLYAVAWPAQGIYTDFDLTDVSQLKGLRIRAPNINTQRFVENVGGKPTETEEADIPTAFSTGRVDAMITSSSTGKSMSAWDYVKHYNDAKLWLPKNIVFVNKRAFDRLDESTQQAVLDAAKAAETRGWEASKADADESAKVLTENGFTISEPDAKLAEDLKAAGDKLFQDWKSRAGEEGQQLLERYRADLDT
ncbi:MULTISPECIES: TRAP transporter substrate-binding protein [unclassified Cobetia]|uniref:TRAP transporter substrate-binding protein n=1 Tax=unclassified Cobetia TaxID=2609414 RepID=UPI000E9F230E|nr:MULTISPECIES: TRAP transporter substrate-binding protein [unclassified Cobetia]MBR9798639.1 TRAP transporter substrate-binding protein [Gammaproteobacteria bacterium]BBO57219.1 exported protein [Cobetia sp. AM6]HAR10124.1 C4-dicarboxylate ABC transporter substrate-binding protein [Cobetia sp.]HBJ29380.1 C4-dicarboxylate ABC transporter substrate-binding protein [Cobetia sp.]|tara:strand:+ start:2459 stop:3478 length:1020 start_codon:yes stop_codon:yes gene_type:complete